MIRKEALFAKLGEETKAYGNKVLLVYGMGSVKRNGVYDQVVASLTDAGVEFYKRCTAILAEVAAAEAGVKAIHCEKPMATTWGDAKRMAQVCDRHIYCELRR